MLAGSVQVSTAYSPMPVRQDLQETKDAPSERGKPLPLAGGESLVEQAEDGSGQQNDERPNHAPDHPLKNINPGSLGVNPGYGRRGLAGVSTRISTLVSVLLTIG